ncbi:CPBP family intramembrane glutamic endopeptidase [Streptomyces sp. TRM 70361]|uniref:CPBP family intramembrane glutamic endopeptidase n=1 Tax=Streptomyces sp. TRM 70361 TaxID=3116553 RepID=UPI002E7B05E4|nr:CPBP family intramembrane glutamic endopeptidase [Streptomyces sp. TRM 70361]MEE1940885.1 CPBP family intramembrane glutamic endopeptidase [Streptomyces sp. TRM 70361]
MSRLLLVAAVAPAFALLLGTVIAVSVRLRTGGTGARGAVERLAPVLYAGTVAAAALTAAVLAGFDPGRLGLVSGAAADGAVLAAATACGVLAGAGGYLGELLLAHRAAAGPGPGGRTGPEPPPPPRAPAAGTRSVGAWAAAPRALLALGLVTGLAEEVLFRGYLLTGLRGAVPLWAAVVLQAVLFGAHHASFGLRAVPAKAVHGLVWGALAAASGSLLPAVAAHLVFQVLVCRRLTRARARAEARDTGAEPAEGTGEQAGEEPGENGEGGATDDRAHGAAAVRRPPVAG